MARDRAHADDQPLCDLLVRHSGRGKACHVPFPAAQYLVGGASGPRADRAHTELTKQRSRPVGAPSRTQPHEGVETLLRCPGRRSEEHTSELQSLAYLVCRLLLEKKKEVIAVRPGHQKQA